MNDKTNTKIFGTEFSNLTYVGIAMCIFVVAFLSLGCNIIKL
jgi:hypothetical protein